MRISEQSSPPFRQQWMNLCPLVSSLLLGCCELSNCACQQNLLPSFFVINSLFISMNANMSRFLLAILSALLIVGSCSAFAPTQPAANTIRRSNLETQQNAIWDTISSIKNNWGKKVTASHILFKPSQFPEDEAKVKLTEMKVSNEIS